LTATAPALIVATHPRANVLHPSGIVADLRRTVLETVKRALDKQDVGAMIDFPNYGNVGDSAIWLGQLACLRTLGIRSPRYICDVRTYDRAELARRVGSGAILLTGGGNFGDLWPAIHRVREDVIAHFPHNRILQLPQTIHFVEADALARSRALVRAHPGLTLLVRDHKSLAIARDQLGVPSYLCPDMAFCLPAGRATTRPDRDMLWLMRTDAERGVGASMEAQPRERVDWVDDIDTAMQRINRRLSAALKRSSGPVHRWATRATTEPLARQRLARGVRLLSRGRVVVTDRLHGHILCVLRGAPHVVLDDRFGKLSGFRDVWTREAEGVRWATSLDEATALAAELLRSA
jgi:exopolysaccharide biosynthesis predicted pyruvyltransferase EpsI